MGHARQQLGGHTGWHQGESGIVCLTTSSPRGLQNAVMQTKKSAYFFPDKVFESQSRPSYKPSPVVAHADWMYHCRWRKLCRPNFSVTSAAAMALGKSCLFAKTSSTASFNILVSSSRASSLRSRSLLSTT